MILFKVPKKLKSYQRCYSINIIFLNLKNKLLWLGLMLYLGFILLIWFKEIIFIEIFKENENHLVKACLRWMGLENLKAFLNNIIYFNLTLQYNKWMKSFLSLLPERREMRASKKCYPGFGYRIKPRSSCTGVVCATVCVTPHLHFMMWMWHGMA